MRFVETFDFLLVVLLEGFVCLARRQTGVWLHVSGKRGVDRHRGRDDGGGDERGGFFAASSALQEMATFCLLGGRLLRLQVRGRGDLQSLSFALKKKRKVRVSDFLSSRRSKVVKASAMRLHGSRYAMTRCEIYGKKWQF